MEAELIDTLWNVNTPALGDVIKLYDELIDTLWNVNATTQSCLSIITGWN